MVKGTAIVDMFSKIGTDNKMNTGTPATRTVADLSTIAKERLIKELGKSAPKKDLDVMAAIALRICFPVDKKKPV